MRKELPWLSAGAAATAQARSGVKMRLLRAHSSHASCLWGLTLQVQVYMLNVNTHSWLSREAHLRSGQLPCSRPGSCLTSGGPRDGASEA